MTNEQYERQYQEFKERSKQDGRFMVSDLDKRPYLDEDTAIFEYDAQYMYHTAWAAHRVYANKPKKHIDFSSFAYFSTIISSFVPVEFYDYRPIDFQIENFKAGKADLFNLPFSDNSAESVSCMHVLEHVGLGRYGDPISPTGDIEAAKELKRIVAPGGLLYIVLPVSYDNRVYFNAHRNYTYQLTLELFSGLTLRHNALYSINTRSLIMNATEQDYAVNGVGCGCFEFQKVS